MVLLFRGSKVGLTFEMTDLSTRQFDASIDIPFEWTITPSQIPLPKWNAIASGRSHNVVIIIINGKNDRTREGVRVRRLIHSNSPPIAEERFPPIKQGIQCVPIKLRWMAPHT